MISKYDTLIHTHTGSKRVNSFQAVITNFNFVLSQAKNVVKQSLLIKPASFL